MSTINPNTPRGAKLMETMGEDKPKPAPKKVSKKKASKKKAGSSTTE